MTWKSVGRAHLLILIRHIIYSKKNYNYHYVTILFWLNFDTIWFSFIVHSTRKFVRFASLHNLTSSADKLCKSNDLQVQEDLAYKHPKLQRDHYHVMYPQVIHSDVPPNFGIFCLFVHAFFMTCLITCITFIELGLMSYDAFLINSSILYVNNY